MLLTWLAGGVIALLGALCYGALAQRIPESVEGAVGLGTLVLLGLVFVATRRGQPAT